MVPSRYVLNLDNFILGTEIVSLIADCNYTVALLSYRYLGKCLIVGGKEPLPSKGNYPFWIGQKARKVHHLFHTKSYFGVILYDTKGKLEIFTSFC